MEDQWFDWAGLGPLFWLHQMGSYFLTSFGHSGIAQVLFFEAPLAEMEFLGAGCCVWSAFAAFSQVQSLVSIFLDILSASCLSGTDSKTDQFSLGHCVYVCDFETGL